MNTTITGTVGRCWLAAATVLAGGTVLGTCELRVRQALVETAQSTVLTGVGCLPALLDPEGDVPSECTLFTREWGQSFVSH